MKALSCCKSFFAIVQPAFNSPIKFPLGTFTLSKNVSQNGDFFIYGDMFNISSDGIINLTDKDILQKRKLLMQEITNEELISFKANEEPRSIQVYFFIKKFM